MTQQKINVINISGGDSADHDFSLTSSTVIAEALKTENDIQVHCVEICKDGKWRYKNGENNAVFGNNEGSECELRMNHDLVWGDNCVRIDYAIPYIGGNPGESGHLTSFMELINMPYFGVMADWHQACFNKITQKLYAEKLNIPQVEYIFVEDNSDESMRKIRYFFNTHGSVVVKPARSGSSIGISQANSERELVDAVKLASSIDSCLVVERFVPDYTEYLISCVEIDGELHILEPMSCRVKDGGVFSFHKKFISNDAVIVKPVSTSDSSQVATLREYSRCLFHGMGMRHCARIDFLVCDNGDLMLMEINTFPGLVPGRSFLPMAFKNAGIPIVQLFASKIRQQVANSRSMNHVSNEVIRTSLSEMMWTNHRVCNGSKIK